MHEKLNEEIVFLNKRCCKSSADRIAKLCRLSLHISISACPLLTEMVIHHIVVGGSFIGAFIYNFYVFLSFLVLCWFVVFLISGSKVYTFSSVAVNYVINGQMITHH